jgi:hypothetical protein
MNQTESVFKILRAEPFGTCIACLENGGYGSEDWFDSSLKFLEHNYLLSIFSGILFKHSDF